MTNTNNTSKKSTKTSEFMRIVECIDKVLIVVKEHGMEQGCIKAKLQLKIIQEMYNINEIQSVLFCLILESFGEESVSLTDIARTLKCRKMLLLQYMDDLDELQRKKLICLKITGGFLHKKRSFPEYVVPVEVLNSVRENKGYICEEYNNLTPIEMFERFDQLFQSCVDDEINHYILIQEVLNALHINKEIAFSEKAIEYHLNEQQIIILLVFCTCYIFEDENAIEIDELCSKFNAIYGRKEAREINNSLKNIENKLFKIDLLECDCFNGMADTQHIKMTKKAKDEFLVDVIEHKKTKSRNKNYIHVDNIKEKELFFNEKLCDNIHELTELLQEENFSNIRKRLSGEKLRVGFACLFSGPPGVGKTEAVYQIAKATGRDVMSVDIDQTKGMFFGQSEKLIKGVFDKYRCLVNEVEKIPILFFNEADGILSKRQEIGNSKNGVAKTENSMQNILLQEIENLNGILIATTNFQKNLDDAFSRRFLYKIEFTKPDKDIQKRIWRSQISILSDIDAASLAGEFNFSGGQIENISRRSHVSYILKGDKPNIDTLRRFCKEEKAEAETTRRIGFNT